MDRRKFLSFGAAGAALIAGCTSQSADDSDEDPADSSGTATPRFELLNLQYPETLAVGDSPEVTVAVKNLGDSRRTEVITLFWDGAAVQESIELDPGSRGTVTFETEPITTGGPFGFEVVAQSDSSLEGTIRVSRRTLHYVAPDGSDDNPGTESAPIATIQHALERARPGDTIQVRPGKYKPRGGVQTVRAGTADDPITITGPPDAVFNADGPFEFNHSHVHLTGLTFDGLYDPDNPEDPDSYSWALLEVNETFHERIKSGDHRPESVDEENYLRDIVVKPHAVGNCRADFIKVHWSKNVEIGEFEVIGPAGVKYIHGDATGHNGEVVYLGNSADKGWPTDETSDVHVHHIDNSKGYPHAELVDVKSGCHDVLIEYCTDGGDAGAFVLEGHDSTDETAFALSGRDITLRWNVVENSNGQAVEVGTWGVTHPDEFERQKGVPFPDELLDTGRANSIYGNRFVENAGRAVQYPIVYPDDGEPRIAEGYGPDAQTRVCGNVVDGPTHGTPDTECPDGVPDTEAIGHLGGDSPWT